MRRGLVSGSTPALQESPRTSRVGTAAAGRQKARQLPKPAAMDKVGMFHIYEYVERAIKAAREFHLDRQFVVRDGEVIIVDEFTGRMSEGRKWRDGIHQAVEAKTGVDVTVETGQAARITVQDFFLRYEQLAGMTGTAIASAGELRKIYRCHVMLIPTNRPCIRQRLPDYVFGTADAKWEAILEEVCRLHAEGRPLLIGTRSIDKSEHLSELLHERGIEHQVLNANHIEEEAEIIAQAGLLGRVTVSTNMAGRGTDIKLGEGVVELGGLHVICTEMHDSARIDRQLSGRCARQGDPGTFRQYLALDDDLLEAGFGPKRGKKYTKLGESGKNSLAAYAGIFRRAEEGRASPFSRPPGADVFRETTEEDGAANGTGSVSRLSQLNEVEGRGGAVMGTGNRERIVWRSCGLLSLLLVPCRVAVGDPSRAQPLPPDTGRLEIEGPTIERLTLRKFGPPPYNDSLVFDHPGPVVSLQMGDYLVDRIELKGGYYCYGGPMLTIRDKPYRLKIGGPLKPTVSTTRGGRS